MAGSRPRAEGDRGGGDCLFFRQSEENGRKKTALMDGWWSAVPVLLGCEALRMADLGYSPNLANNDSPDLGNQSGTFALAGFGERKTR